MFRAAAEMKVAAQPVEGKNPIGHSQLFLLVDGSGTVRGFYDGLDPAALDRLVKDAAKLAPARPAAADAPAAAASRPATSPHTENREGRDGREGGAP